MRRILNQYKKKAAAVIFLLFTIMPACDNEDVIMPRLNTIKAEDSDITSTSAVLKGEILVVGNQKIVEYGIEISKTFLFSPSSTKAITTTPVTGIFQVEFTGLDPNTQYYFKAYAMVNTAPVYSQNNENFTTKE